MNILVISQYFFPEDFRVNDICRELVQRGHRVTVITGLPNYPEGIIYRGYEKAYKTIEDYNGVRVIRCKSRPRKKGLLNLLINYYSYSIRATRIVKKLNERFDVIYGYQLSPIMQMIPAIKYKQRFGVPLFMYVCDIWPESMREIGKTLISKRNIFYKFFLRLSKKIYRNADSIGTKCQEFIEYLVDVCQIERNKCHNLYEHAERNYLSIDETPFENGITDFLFCGNIGHSSDCDVIVKAVSLIKDLRFIVHFVGDGSELESVKKLAKQLNVDDKVVFHGRHPQSDVLHFYEIADVCILTISNKSLSGLTPPAKLSSYMAASRPIIAAADGASQRIISDANCGYCCHSGDVYALAELMKTAIENKEVLISLGKNGRSYFAKEFSLTNHVDNLINLLAEMEK